LSKVYASEVFVRRWLKHADPLEDPLGRAKHVKRRTRSRGEPELTPRPASRRIAAMGLAMRAFSIVVAAGLFASGAEAQVWQWVDSEGGVRYTPDPSTIPDSRRESIVLVEPGMPMLEVPAHSTLYAPASEYSAAADPFAAPGAARRGGPGGADAFGSATPDYPPHLASRRAELLALIARDEARVKDLISQDDPDNDPETIDPELREIAQRLPSLQAELRAVDRAAAASRPR